MVAVLGLPAAWLSVVPFRATLPPTESLSEPLELVQKTFSDLSLTVIFSEELPRTLPNALHDVFVDHHRVSFKPVRRNDLQGLLRSCFNRTGDDVDDNLNAINPQPATGHLCQRRNVPFDYEVVLSINPPGMQEGAVYFARHRRIFVFYRVIEDIYPLLSNVVSVLMAPPNKESESLVGSVSGIGLKIILVSPDERYHLKSSADHLEQRSKERAFSVCEGVPEDSDFCSRPAEVLDIRLSRLASLLPLNIQWEVCTSTLPRDFSERSRLEICFSAVYAGYFAGIIWILLYASSPDLGRGIRTRGEAR